MPLLAPASGDDDLSRELNAFAKGTEAEASAAFGRLADQARPRLARVVRRYGIPADSTEDVVQLVLIKVWNSRSGFRPMGPAAWWAFLRKAALNCVRDAARERGLPDVPLEDIGEPADDEMPFLDILIAAADDLERLFAAADRLWLGVPPNCDDFDSRVLAAQYVYIDEASPDDIADWLCDRRVDRLDEWLGDPSVLRNLAYISLYRSNDRLTGEVLNPEQPCTPTQLDELGHCARAGRGDPPGGWTWDEVQVVLWRVRNGLLIEQIDRFQSCRLDRDQIETVFARCLERFPFERIALDLRLRVPASAHRSTLAHQGLWRRLAFQYRYVNQLPHKQVLERTERPAEVCGFDMSDITLSGWIGMGRLLKQLAVYVAKEDSDA